MEDDESDYENRAVRGTDSYCRIALHPGIALGAPGMMTAGRAVGRFRGELVPRAARAAEPGVRASRHVAEVQRARIMSAAVRVVMEEGYGQMSVARVTARARVSRRTFYDFFEDREACFLACFDQAVEQMCELARTVWLGEQAWDKRVRSTLGLLLGYLDERLGIGLMVIVEALAAGPQVLRRRAELVARLADLVDEGRQQAGASAQPGPLIGEGVVGAVSAVLHGRLLEDSNAYVSPLLNSLMGLIVGPYLGVAAARAELRRQPLSRAAHRRIPSDPLEGLNMRLTARTLLVLVVVSKNPGASNRQIAEGAGIADQGQTSRLLARLGRAGFEPATSRVAHGDS